MHSLHTHATTYIYHYHCHYLPVQRHHQAVPYHCTTHTTDDSTASSFENAGVEEDSDSYEGQEDGGTVLSVYLTYLYYLVLYYIMLCVGGCQ